MVFLWKEAQLPIRKSSRVINASPEATLLKEEPDALEAGRRTQGWTSDGRVLSDFYCFS